MFKRTFYFIILFLLGILAMMSCRNTKSISRDHIQTYAWSEDSTHGYYLRLTEKRFSYELVTITRENRNPQKKVYTGIYTHLIDKYDNGKYLLRFDDGVQPPGFTDYLIQEASGGYLIQPFTNGKKRMFLRIRSAVDGR